MGVVTLILGTCSFTYAQTNYNTTAAPQYQQQQQPQQSQPSNQKSGGIISKIGGWIKGDDEPSNNHVAPANVPLQQEQYQQPQPQQQYHATQVTPPRPNSGPYSAAPTTTGTRQPSAQTTSLSQQLAARSAAMPPTSGTTPAQRPSLTSTTGGRAAPGTSARMEELQLRAANINVNQATRIASAKNSSSLSAGGPPTPPSAASTSEASLSISMERNVSKGDSLSTDDSESPVVRRALGDSLSTDDDIPEVKPEARSNKSDTIETPLLTSQENTTQEPERRSENMGKPVPTRQTSLPAPPDVKRQEPSRPVPVQRTETPPLTTWSERGTTAKPITPIRDDGLVRQQSPVLSYVIKGLEKVTVGKEETYTFTVSNNSPVVAEGVMFTIDLPRWAESTQAPELTAGSTAVLPQESNDYVVFQWKIGEIAANKSETLKLHIVLRERRSFDLKPDLKFAQSASHAKIEVQQPVIKMELEGPDTVLWGVEESYRLRVRNIGNGEAKGLVLKLSASDETTIDSLKVGEDRVFDIIVAAQQSDLQIHVQATGPYGLSEETTKNVNVRRAHLELDIDAPGMQHVGNLIEYVLIARNTGTADSTNSVLEVTLPLGVRYESSSHEGIYDSDKNRVRWEAGTIPVGGEFVCTLACEAKREGECRLEARATESTGLLQASNAATYVEAIADLTLAVEKPKGPIEVGTTAEYEIIVTNRGTKAAENIDIAAYFSPEAIEPLGVENAVAQIDVDKHEVVFERVPVLAAGESLRYKVKVRGLVSGNHKMQAVMVCPSIETSLATEQVSRFYNSRNSAANIGVTNESHIQSRSFDSTITNSQPRTAIPTNPPVTASDVSPLMRETTLPPLSPVPTSIPAPPVSSTSVLPLVQPPAAPLPSTHTQAAPAAPALSTPPAENRVATANTTPTPNASPTASRGTLLSDSMQSESNKTAPGVNMNLTPPNVTVTSPSRLNRTGSGTLAPPPTPSNAN